MFYPDDNNCQCRPNPEKKQISFIRFLNAVPNEPNISFDIYINRKLVIHHLKYEDFTEYIPARAGVHMVQVFPADNHTEQLLDIRLNLEPDKIYTAAIIGPITHVEIEMFEDKFIEGNEDYAHMRFINLSPSETSLNVLIDDTPVVYDLKFTEATDYLRLEEGKHTMLVETSDENKRVIYHPNMVLKNGNIYTAYMVGYTDGEPFIQTLIPLDGSSYIEIK